MAYPKTVKQFTDKLFTALEENTYYWNAYPYNLGFYHSDKRFSFDCVNLVKAVLNGWEAKHNVGYFVNNLSRTGDCDEWGLISQCSGVSSDFTKLKDVSVLYMSGHIGTFVGDFKIGNKTFNTIECTSNRWGDGVIVTYVDSAGARRQYKGSADVCGHWTRHGKLTKWLTYKDKKFDYNKALRIAVKMERGDFGDNPERKEKVVKKYGEDYYRAAQDAINAVYK